MAKGFKPASGGLNGSEERNATTEASEPLSSKLKISMGTDEHASLGKTEYTPPEHTVRMDSKTEYTQAEPESEYTSSYTPAYAPIRRKKGKIIAGIAAVVFCAVAVVGLCFTMKQSSTGISEPINKYSGEATTDTYTESYTGNTSTGNTSTGYRTAGKPVDTNSKEYKVFSFYADSTSVKELAGYRFPNGFNYSVPIAFQKNNMNETYNYGDKYVYFNSFSYSDNYAIAIFHGDKNSLWNATLGEDYTSWISDGDELKAFISDFSEGFLEWDDEVEHIFMGTGGEVVKTGDNNERIIGYKDDKTLMFENVETDSDNTADICIVKCIDDGDDIKIFWAGGDNVYMNEEATHVIANLEEAARIFN